MTGANWQESFTKTMASLRANDETQWEEQEAERKRNDDFMRYCTSGVGARYFNLTLEDFITDTKERKDSLDKIKGYIAEINAGKKKSMWLCGAKGCGKTFLASMIVRYCGGRFVRAYEIADEFLDAGSFSAKKTRAELARQYAKYKVLVIDEVGRSSSQNEVEWLFRVINARYEADKPTVLVTNKNKQELKEYLGASLFDRFVENSTSFEFGGKSFRLEHL